MEKANKNNTGRIIYIVAFAIVTVLLSLFAVFYKMGIVDLQKISAFINGIFVTSNETPQASTKPSDSSEKGDNNEAQEPITLDLPMFMKGIYLDAGSELDLTKSIYNIKTQLREKIVYYHGLGINTCIYDNVVDPRISKVITETLRENGIYSYVVYSLSSENTITNQQIYDDADKLKEFFADFSPDAILFDDYYNVNDGEADDTELFDMTHKRLSVLRSTVKVMNPYIAVGLMADPVNLNSEIGASYSFETENDGFFSFARIGEGDEPDLVIVRAPFSVNNSVVPYEKFLDYWCSVASNRGITFCTLLYNEKLFTASDWNNPVEIVQQLIASTKREVYGGVAFNSLDLLIENKQSSTSSLIKYINEDLDAESIMKELTISEPLSRSFTTSEDRVLFRGTTDVNFEVLINGEPAARNESGMFAAYVPLKVGTNRIIFEHKGKTITYTITRTVVVLKDVSPTATVALDGGTVLTLEATAYAGSTVTATVNGKRITLTADAGATSGSSTLYNVYRGSYTLPESTDTEQNLGAIYFYASYSGITGSKYGATVIVKEKPVISESTEPGTMIKVTNKNLPFTYSASSTYYFPCPDQSFLPPGTMDYINGEPFTIKDGSTTYTFIKTRSGKRFQIKDVEILSTRDMGMNSISSVTCSQSGTYLSFNFGMSWNIPFNITAEGISYRKNEYQDFNIVTYNANKVVISFDYTVSVESFTLPDNGLFSSYHWEKTINDGIDRYNLVLTLKNKNCYTGYVTEYTADGKLNIKFNNPLYVADSSNEYGGTLNGTVIALSAGHGGWDGGAVGTHNNTAYLEKDINAAIVTKLKAELEKAGATVVLCNALSSNVPDYRARSKEATAAGAQIHIVIHQNSASASSTGFETWYYSPCSYQIGEYMNDAMESFYRNHLYGSGYLNKMRRGNFFSWISDTMFPTCPTVLLETGFISNETECLALSNSEMQEKLAKELTKGIVNYAKAQR